MTPFVVRVPKGSSLLSTTLSCLEFLLQGKSFVKAVVYRSLRFLLLMLIVVDLYTSNTDNKNFQAYLSKYRTSNFLLTSSAPCYCYQRCTSI